MFIIFSYKPHIIVAIDPPVVIKTYETYKEREVYVKYLVKINAEKYKVSESSLWNTIKNENYTLIFNQQSKLKYKANNRWGFPNGTQEKSYGLAQIHLPDHKKVSYEDAIKPEYAVDFMAYNFSKGRQRWWMGYEK